MIDPNSRFISAIYRPFDEPEDWQPRLAEDAAVTLGDAVEIQDPEKLRVQLIRQNQLNEMQTFPIDQEDAVEAAMMAILPDTFSYPMEGVKTVAVTYERRSAENVPLLLRLAPNERLVRENLVAVSGLIALGVHHRRKPFLFQVNIGTVFPRRVSERGIDYEDIADLIHAVPRGVNFSGGVIQFATRRQDFHPK